jgi:hypothetical protein
MTETKVDLLERVIEFMMYNGRVVVDSSDKNAESRTRAKPSYVVMPDVPPGFTIEPPAGDPLAISSKSDLGVTTNTCKVSCV